MAKKGQEKKQKAPKGFTSNEDVKKLVQKVRDEERSSFAQQRKLDKTRIRKELFQESEKFKAVAETVRAGREIRKTKQQAETEAYTADLPAYITAHPNFRLIPLGTKRKGMKVKLGLFKAMKAKDLSCDQLRDAIFVRAEEDACSRADLTKGGRNEWMIEGGVQEAAVGAAIIARHPELSAEIDRRAKAAFEQTIRASKAGDRQRKLKDPPAYPFLIKAIREVAPTLFSDKKCASAKRKEDQAFIVEVVNEKHSFQPDSTSSTAASSEPETAADLDDDRAVDASLASTSSVPAEAPNTRSLVSSAAAPSSSALDSSLSDVDAIHGRPASVPRADSELIREAPRYTIKIKFAAKRPIEVSTNDDQEDGGQASFSSKRRKTTAASTSSRKSEKRARQDVDEDHVEWDDVAGRRDRASNRSAVIQRRTRNRRVVCRSSGCAKALLISLLAAVVLDPIARNAYA